jgi:L-alanine-DL-glutamate epimerase-like enolase superfamily enzyme
VPDFGELTERHAVLLILDDEDGHQGVGESWVNFPAWAAWERVAMFERALISWLKGRHGRMGHQSEPPPDSSF